MDNRINEYQNKTLWCVGNRNTSMTVEYKGKKYENVERVDFDSSNELGFCVHMIKDVILIGTMSTLKYQVTTLEGINVNELKITK